MPIMPIMPIFARTTLHAIASLSVCVLCNVSASHAEPISARTSPRAILHNYGSNQSAWLDKLRRLDQQKDGITFRILQMGDSHTAEGSFVNSLRLRLQQKWGNGGIGWVYPNTVSGQRNLQVLYQSQGWEVLTSRKDPTYSYFPFGGILNRSHALILSPEEQASERLVTVSPRDSSSGLHKITLTARSVYATAPLTVRSASRTVAELPHKENKNWQHLTFHSTLPFSYQVTAGDIWEVGYINIENGQAGVIASAMSINGTQLGQWQQWRSDWQKDLAATQADLVILAYGTNEAFNSNLDIQATARLWNEHIAHIRQALPNTGILIIGAPESLSSHSGRCGIRPPLLDAVQAMQQQTAKQTQSLYWSWEATMGGRCSMKQWMRQDMAARDGIHFKSEGYRRAGEALAEAIITLVR